MKMFHLGSRRNKSAKEQYPNARFSLSKFSCAEDVLAHGSFGVISQSVNTDGDRSTLETRVEWAAIQSRRGIVIVLMSDEKFPSIC